MARPAWRRRWRSERGSAIADFALVSVVLVPLFFGVLQLALVWHVKTTLTSAAAEGARYGAAYNRTSADGQRRTDAVIDEVFGSDFGAAVSVGELSINGQPAVEVAVKADVPVLAFWGPTITVEARGHAVKGAAVTALGRRRQTERGSALVELTWLGLLLLIPLVYVVITIVTVQRSAFGATEAARAAGRAYVLSPDVGTAQARAYEAARIALHDQGVRLDRSDVHIVCHPSPQSCLQPGSTVEVRLDLDVALPLMPSLQGRSAASIAVESAHVEPYGVYREHRHDLRPALRGLSAKTQRTEQGQITTMLVLFTICLLLAITAVTDVSATYLRRQAATSLADGAALAASDGAAAAGVYGGADDQFVTIGQAAAQAAVQNYLRETGAYSEYPGLQVAVQVDGYVVSVYLSMPYELPVPVPGVAGTTTIHADASSVMPIY